MKDELERVPPMPQKPDQAHLAIPPLGATRKRQLPQKHKVAPITRLKQTQAHIFKGSM